MKLTEVIADGVVVLTNIKLRTDIQGAPYVVAIDGQGSPGVQRAIGIDGIVKCLVCDEVTSLRPVCDNCQGAVAFVRTLQRQLTVQGMKELGDRLQELDEAGLLGLVRLVTLDALKEWFTSQTREIDVEGV